jgi:hypothetical protein
VAHGGSGTYGTFAHLLLGFAFCTEFWRGGAVLDGLCHVKFEQIAAPGEGHAENAA